MLFQAARKLSRMYNKCCSETRNCPYVNGLFWALCRGFVLSSHGYFRGLWRLKCVNYVLFFSPCPNPSRHRDAHVTRHHKLSSWNWSRRSCTWRRHYTGSSSRRRTFPANAKYTAILVNVSFSCVGLKDQTFLINFSFRQDRISVCFGYDSTEYAQHRATFVHLACHPAT